MVWFGLLAFAVGHVPVRAQPAGFPLISAFSSSEIGADAISYCAIQAPDGTLLFGGDSLMSFDGDRWSQTGIEGAYALRGLDFGRDGRLWVAAFGEIGWFERTLDHRWKFHSLLEFLPPSEATVGEVWRVFAEEEGAIFVSGDRILRWTGTRFDVWPLPGGRRLFASKMEGVVYVHHVPTGLYAMARSGPEVRIPRQVLNDAAVFWIEARSHDWLLATSRGIFLFRDGTLHPYAPEVSEILRREPLTSALRLNDGRYALGTFTGGIVLMRADGTLDRVLTEADGLPTRSIKSLYLDRDDGLWAMSHSHIFRTDTSPRNAVFDTRANLPAHAYHAITKHDGQLMIASESGVHELAPDHRRFSAMADVREYVHNMKSTSTGLLLAMRHAVRKLERGVWTTIYETTSDVIAITTSHFSPDVLFISDNRRIVAASTPNDARILVNDMPDIARSIAEDASGHLWLGTLAQGVFLAKPDRESPVDATPIPEAYGLPALIGRSHVRAAPDGAILVFADNGAWLKPTHISRFTPIQGYPIRGIAAVSEFAPDGTGWVVHRGSERIAACVARIRIEKDIAIWEPHSVKGLATIGQPRSIYVEPDAAGLTNLWIGGSTSVLRHVVTRGPIVRQPRPPLLRGSARGGRNPPAPIAAPLPFDTRAIEFEFAAPEFSRRSSLRLETRIEGIDGDWVLAGADSRRELSGLRDGRYKFEVRAIAETGITSDSSVLNFEVLPPWWRTSPAIAFGVLAFIPLGYGIYRLRVRSLRRRNAQLERKVRERTEELERANAAKTQFVANISHDIRNPLNGIVGLALALEDTRLDHRQREIVSTLRECTTYLSSLVDDVLDFASIEAGRVELRPRAFGPQELLRSIVETLKADATASGAVLSIETDDRLPPNLFGDAGRIQQILVNFVSNALKYAGGRIRLSVHAPANAPGEVEFAVTDAGAGISADGQATLFTKFSRLRPQRGGEHIPGTGLGLAACRLLADIMGGSVGVISREGHGARFFLRLPLTVAAERMTAPTAHLPNTTVLLVEDTEYNAWAATAVLAKLGLSCERACTGAEAIRLFGEKRFNVVLLDRNLPDMDGTEVARRMRELESDGRQSVLLAVTAYCTAEDRELCLRSGMDAFLGKPLTPEKLRNVLLAAGRRLLAGASVHSVPEAQLAEIDLTLLNYLSDGSPAGLEAQTKRFLATLEESAREMTAAASAQDFARLRTSAHRLLGQARMVGATQLSDAAANLESAARTEEGGTCNASLQRVHEEIQHLTAALRHHRPTATTV